MEKKKLDIVGLANSDGCFDLQFRKDTRHERTGSPTYYRWKIQFVITSPKENLKVLEKVAKEFKCGSVSVAANQARFCVQKIDDIVEVVIPYFTRHSLGDGGLSKNKFIDSKKQEFGLWQKAAAIVYQNKGIYLSKWKKNDLMHLMEIHKTMAKYKQKPRQGKWIELARTISKKEAA